MRSNQVFETVLRDAGYKATKGRLAILSVLKRVAEPLSIEKIIQCLTSKKLDRVTIYRALHALTEADIIKRIDLEHRHAHYELNVGRKHHHHVVCKSCGTIEDIEDCDAADLEKVALKKTKSFALIKTHSLEFFGICRKCA